MEENESFGTVVFELLMIHQSGGLPQSCRSKAQDRAWDRDADLEAVGLWAGIRPGVFEVAQEGCSGRRRRSIVKHLGPPTLRGKGTREVG